MSVKGQSQKIWYSRAFGVDALCSHFKELSRQLCTKGYKTFHTRRVK